MDKSKKERKEIPHHLDFNVEFVNWAVVPYNDVITPLSGLSLFKGSVSFLLREMLLRI